MEMVSQKAISYATAQRGNNSGKDLTADERCVVVVGLFLRPTPRLAAESNGVLANHGECPYTRGRS
jgi:hypothetical protein